MRWIDTLAEETVGELPLRPVIEVKGATIVRAAVALMRTMELGCSVVINSRRQPIGIFTERSLLEVLVQQAELDFTPVSEYLDPDFIVLKASDPLVRVWDAVHQQGIRFICVTNDAGEIQGLTGQRGLAEFVAEYFSQQVMVQRLGSKPWLAEREGA